jgi:tryptophan synthase alpha chain
MPEATRATGTQRIADAFAVARADGRAALMPYMMAGFPSRETSAAVADAYADAGADLVELGVPFSDPLADGPVIHAAATRALESGTTFDDALEIGAEISARVPVVPMTYVNMVLARGAERFADTLVEAGAAGAIVPDLPPDEAGEIASATRDVGRAFIPLVSPTTPADRLRTICAAAEGFVYVVSDTRVTGERDQLPAHLTGFVEAVRAVSPVPVAVGFGIGTPEHAAAVGKIADGVIVGSRLVRAVAEASGSESAAAAVADFIAAAKSAMTA